MFACTLHFQKLESLAYIFVADSMGLSSFKFVQWAPKDASFLHQNAFWLFKVIQGRWFWYQSKARMRLPISPSLWLCPILHRFWDTATNWLKTAYFSYSYLIRCPRSLCLLWNFAVKLSVRKLESWAILQWRPRDRSLIESLWHNASVWWTNRQTAGRIYYS